MVSMDSEDTHCHRARRLLSSGSTARERERESVCVSVCLRVCATERERFEHQNASQRSAGACPPPSTLSPSFSLSHTHSLANTHTLSRSRALSPSLSRAVDPGRARRGARASGTRATEQAGAGPAEGRPTRPPFGPPHMRATRHDRTAHGGLFTPRATKGCSGAGHSTSVTLSR